MSEEHEIQASGTEPKAPKPAKARKGFRLFKRDDSGNDLAYDAPGWKERDYYFRVQVHGKRYVRCLETNDATEAQKRARLKANEIRDSLAQSDYKRLEKTKLRKACAVSVAQIIAAYRSAPVDANADTRQQNICALRLVLGRTLATENPDNLTADNISGTTARKWFSDARLRVQVEADQTKQQSLMQTTNSRFAQARSLFSARALLSYKDAGINLDCFAEFAEAFNTHKFTRIAKTDYNPPSDAIITATLEAWKALTDRNVFLAVGHELAFGLRKGEMAQARWSWWTTRQGYPVLDSAASPEAVHVKNHSGRVHVRALDPFYTIMRLRIAAEGWRAAENDYILSGSEADRNDGHFRSVSQWMRSLGWNTQKTNHALRAWSGSQIAMKFGIYDAQGWLRHSTVKVTEDHYAYFVKTFKPANLDTIPVQWAVQQSTPELRILPAANA